MNNAAVNKAKIDLDIALSTLSQNNAVMFGDELFQEFRARGWLTVETFGMLGSSLFAERVPAYDKTHFSFVSWDIPPDQFRVK